MAALIKGGSMSGRGVGFCYTSVDEIKPLRSHPFSFVIVHVSACAATDACIGVAPWSQPSIKRGRLLQDPHQASFIRMKLQRPHAGGLWVVDGELGGWV